MSESTVTYRVFIASPGGLEEERHAFRSTVNEFNSSQGFQCRVIFRSVGWEDVLGGEGRPQDLINFSDVTTALSFSGSAGEDQQMRRKQVIRRDGRGIPGGARIPA